MVQYDAPTDSGAGAEHHQYANGNNCLQWMGAICSVRLRSKQRGEEAEVEASSRPNGTRGMYFDDVEQESAAAPAETG